MTDLAEKLRLSDRFAEMCRPVSAQYSKGEIDRHTAIDQMEEKRTFLDIDPNVAGVIINSQLNGADKERKLRAKVKANSHDTQPEIELVCAASVITRPVEWLWENRLAIGKLTVFSGESELGKSTISCDIVGRLTSDKHWKEWPDGTPAATGNAIIVSSEDGMEDTLNPRLIAAGADLNRIHYLRSVKKKGTRYTFNLASDLALLGQKIDAIGNVKLAVFDPVTAYLGDRIDSHQATPVRAILEPLQEFAERARFSGLLIAHPPKAASANVLNNVSGSGAFVHIPRLSFVTVKDPDNNERTLFLPGKNNIGLKAPGQGYRLGRVCVSEEIFAAKIIWDNLPVTVTANEALARAISTTKPTARDEAEDFLREHTKGQGIAAKDLHELARENGISRRTLARASKKLGIKPRKDGKEGGWWWQA